MKVAFRTSSGRTVFDGGGLDPDIAIDNESPGSALIELVRSGLVFDFATKYCNQHTAPSTLQNFRLTDPDYSQFEAWIKGQPFTYNTDLEKQAENLIAAAKNEKYYADLQSSLTTLQTKIEQNHSAYLTRFRVEIQQYLEEEIAFHYALNKGKCEISFSRDKEITEAKRILNDSEAYKKLLMPH